MKKLFWKAAVCLFMTLAIIGALIPGMPTTVFLILAAWAASKGWPEMDAWLMAHPKYGTTLRNWRENGTVSRQVKIIACGMILLSAIIMIFTNAPFWVKIFTILIMFVVALWLASRPEAVSLNNTLNNTLNKKVASSLQNISTDNIGHNSIHHVEQQYPFTAQAAIKPFELKDADVVIDLSQQRLYLPKQNKHYAISSGKNGIGEQEGSGKTPRGWHRICEKIGAEAPENAIFVARQWTGEIYSAALALQYPERDWILSRVLWLDGLELGFNQGDGCDSKARYIYIHGTPDSEPMGSPQSHGCIRMRNGDVIEFFHHLPVNALVYIAPTL